MIVGWLASWAMAADAAPTADLAARLDASDGYCGVRPGATADALAWTCPQDTASSFEGVLTDVAPSLAAAGVTRVDATIADGTGACARRGKRWKCDWSVIPDALDFVDAANRALYATPDAKTRLAVAQQLLARRAAYAQQWGDDQPFVRWSSLWKLAALAEDTPTPDELDLLRHAVTDLDGAIGPHKALTATERTELARAWLTAGDPDHAAEEATTALADTRADDHAARFVAELLAGDAEVARGGWGDAFRHYSGAQVELDAFGGSVVGNEDLAARLATFSRGLGTLWAGGQIARVGLDQVAADAGDAPLDQRKSPFTLRAESRLLGEVVRIDLAAAFSGAPLGSLEEVQVALQRKIAIDTIVAGSPSRALAQDLSLLAELSLALPDTGSSAVDPATQARQWLEAWLGPTHPDVADALVIEALALARAGDLDAAADRLSRATGGRYPTRRDWGLALTAWLETRKGTSGAGALRAGDDVAEADVERIFAAGNESAQWQAGERLGRTSGRAVALALAHPGDVDAARLAADDVLRSKGREMDVQAGMRRPTGDPQVASWLSSLAARDASVAHAVLAGPGAGDVDAWRAGFDQGDGAMLEIQLAAATKATGDVPAWDAVAARLPADAALVDVVAYAAPSADDPVGFVAATPSSAGYAAVVLRPGKEPRVVDLGPAERMDDAVAAFRKAVDVCQQGGCRGVRVHGSAPAASADTFASTARALGALAFDPLRPALDGVHHVVLAPDGQLGLVPYEALTSADGRPLVRDYLFTYEVSGRDVPSGAPVTSSGEPALVLGSPTFGGAGTALVASRGLARGALATAVWPELPATKAEADAVAAALPGSRVLEGAAATEAALKAVHGPKVLHVATHGFFAKGEPVHGVITPDADPMYLSGIALAGASGLAGDGVDDGLLTAREMYALDLHGTKVAVLSACETGVVDAGRGLRGVRTALAVAGAETQVISLWQVSDDATRDLMTAYYRHLAKGEGRSEAMRSARIELIDGGTWTHPYYWASFVVSGDWRPM